jgi:hypothetical protein
VKEPPTNLCFFNAGGTLWQKTGETGSGCPSLQTLRKKRVMGRTRSLFFCRLQIAKKLYQNWKSAENQVLFEIFNSHKSTNFRKKIIFLFIFSSMIANKTNGRMFFF